MLLNSFMVNTKKLVTDIPTVTGWYDPSNRASQRRGNASANNDNGSLVYSLKNLAKSDFVPTLWQGTDETGPQGYDTNGTLMSLFSGSQNKWLAASEYGKPYNPAAQNASAFPTGSADGWIIALIKVDYQVSNGNKIVFGYGSGATDGFRGIGVNAYAGGNAATMLMTINGNSGASIIEDGANHLGDWVLMSAHFQGYGSYMYINGVAIFGGGAPMNTGNSDVVAFKSPYGNFFMGELGNVVVTGVLTDSERQFIEGVVAWKSNMPNLLPVGHPYKTINPN